MQGEAYIRIPLRARDGSLRAYALLDHEDAQLAEHRWCIDSSGYARRNAGRIDGKWTWVALHRCVLGLDRGDRREGDHINGDRLDNRRKNLRIVTRAQNNQNAAARKDGISRYRGVTWHRGKRKWQAEVKVAGRRYYLGTFAEELDAAHAARAFRRAHMAYAVASREGN